MLVAYSFKVPPKFDLILGQFLINNTYYYYDVPVNSALLFPSTDVLPLRENNWPYFDSFIASGKAVAFDTLVRAYEYLDQFATSRPPMSSKNQVNTNISIDSTYSTKGFSTYKENALA